MELLSRLPLAPRPNHPGLVLHLIEGWVGCFAGPLTLCNPQSVKSVHTTAPETQGSLGYYT